MKLDPVTARPSGRALRVDCDQALAVSVVTVWAGDVCYRVLWSIDAPTNTPVGSRTPVAQSNVRPVVAFGSVWVAGGGSLARVDPVTQQIVATLPVRSHTATPGEGALWVLDLGDGTTGFVTRIDPATNRRVGPRIRLVASS